MLIKGTFCQPLVGYCMCRKAPIRTQLGGRPEQVSTRQLFLGHLFVAVDDQGIDISILLLGVLHPINNLHQRDMCACL